MAITTFAELKTAIANWLDDSSLTTYLPDFIAVAEASINRRVRVQEMQKRTTDTTGTSSRYLAAPTNFAGMASLRINSTKLHGIKFVTNAQIDDFYTSTPGKPDYYTLWGDEIEFNRLCDSDYTVDIKYFEKVTALSDGNTTNDILTYHPDIYLYGSLAAAAPFVGEDPRIAVWKGLFDEAVKEANTYAKRSQQSGSELKMRGVGLKV